jgi:hypothetical protein
MAARTARSGMVTNRATRKWSSVLLGSASISGSGVRRLTVGAAAGMVPFVTVSVSGEAVMLNLALFSGP